MPSIRTYSLPFQEFHVNSLRAYPQKTAELARPFIITATHSLAQSPSVHCSLITAHSSHTFSAKERDAETGLSYFGSRYYSSDLSIWLSVDPMSDKYPSFSPYVYCADNPVKLVDPNGEEIGDFFDYSGKYLGTDGIDDGKIYITTQENWDNCSQLEGGMTLLSLPQFGLSREPSKINLSDDAILNILSFYNTTGKPVTIENRLDNSLLSTHIKSGKLTANVSNWRWNKFLDNSYDIKSSFDHEKGHFKQRKEIGVNAMLKKSEKECEKYAIDYQQNQPNYDKTSSDFKKEIEKLKNKTK